VRDVHRDLISCGRAGDGHRVQSMLTQRKPSCRPALFARARWPLWFGVVIDLIGGHTAREHALHCFTIDFLALSARSVAHGAMCDSVDVA
jgi:hypothetical protein